MAVSTAPTKRIEPRPSIDTLADELSETFRYSFLKLLCVETAEISATLIALSVPGIKPMFDKYILRKDIESVPSGRGTPLDHGDPIGSEDLEMRPWTESDEPHLSK